MKQSKKSSQKAKQPASSAADNQMADDVIIEGDATIIDDSMPPKQADASVPTDMPSEGHQQTGIKAGIIFAAFALAALAIIAAIYSSLSAMQLRSDFANLAQQAQDDVSKQQAQITQQKALIDRLSSQLAEAELVISSLAGIDEKITVIEGQISALSLPSDAVNDTGISKQDSVILMAWQAAQKGEEIAYFQPLLSWLDDNGVKDAFADALALAGTSTHENLLAEWQQLTPGSQSNRNGTDDGYLASFGQWLAQAVKLQEIDPVTSSKAVPDDSKAATYQPYNLADAIASVADAPNEAEQDWVIRARARLQAEEALYQLVMQSLRQTKKTKEPVS